MYTYRFTGDLPVVIVTPDRNYDVSHGDVIESDSPIDHPFLDPVESTAPKTKAAAPTSASTEEAATSESSSEADATKEQ